MTKDRVYLGSRHSFQPTPVLSLTWSSLFQEEDVGQEGEVEDEDDDEEEDGEIGRASCRERV